MSKLEIKKMLEGMDKKELILFILDMYDSKKEIKDYIDFYADPDEDKKFQRAKSIIKDEFFPERGFPRCRLNVLRKTISDFLRLKASPKLEAELMLYLVECGCEFSHEFGNLGEDFYISLSTYFDKSLNTLQKIDLLDQYRENAEKCAKWASTAKYKFGDEVYNIFSVYF